VVLSFFERAVFINPPDFLEILSAQEPEKEVDFPIEIPQTMFGMIPSVLYRKI